MIRVRSTSEPHQQTDKGSAPAPSLRLPCRAVPIHYGSISLLQPRHFYVSNTISWFLFFERKRLYYLQFDSPLLYCNTSIFQVKNEINIVSFAFIGIYHGICNYKRNKLHLTIWIELRIDIYLLFGSYLIASLNQ